jgi:hypothetical protein
MHWTEVWGFDRAIQRVVSERAASTGDADRLLRTEWALSELQYDGGTNSQRPSFARVPDAILRQSLAHASAHVRLFGIERFGRRLHQVVMDPTSPMPPGRASVESMAIVDPDPAVRRRAAEIVIYAESFVHKK